MTTHASAAPPRGVPTNLPTMPLSPKNGSAPKLLLPKSRIAPAITVQLKDAVSLTLDSSWMATASAAIDAKAASADVAGKLGAQTVSTLDPTADGQGVFKTYQNGWVMWRADRGALAVYGAIGARWNEYGGTVGFYGWPRTDELSTPRGPGRYNHFDGGSIYWGPQTGAHLVYGAIRDLWASMAWEQGALGLPTTDEEDVPGAPGARRNSFEGGEITWTPWAGARVTMLFVPGEASGAGLTIQTVGGGGNPAPAPQVNRHVIITAVMDITDDETFGSNEHGHVERRDERWVDSWDPQGVMQLIGKAGGEVRVELTATAAIRPDGSVRLQVDVKLFEGTSEETNDLDGTRSTTQIVPVGQVVQIPIRINNDDEGGDFADISLVISNSNT
jgi:hypothetical protein